MLRLIAAALRIGDRTIERHVTDSYGQGTIGPRATVGAAACFLRHHPA